MTGMVMNKARLKHSEIANSSSVLQRQVGVWGATMMGLGSILGTGIFVSIGVAAGVAGPSVILAIAIAALVAACNALSSAQLAADHPVSGGTYEYGYRWLNPTLGFTAGWMFLCAKSASAATAALGLAGYALHALGSNQTQWIIPLAFGTVVCLTALVLAGIKRSNQVNVVIVSVTVLSLSAFVMVGLPQAIANGIDPWQPFFPSIDADASGLPGRPIGGFLEACALMFVAYTGYGRIATLGEEISEPKKNIPIAIICTLAVSMILYLGVCFVAIGATGVTTMSQATLQHAAPLELVSRQFRFPAVSPLIAFGAVTAMLGVLLNLILGLSRVTLAMGRRGDMPSILARLGKSSSTPYASVLLVGGIIAAITLIGSVKTTWSFSAFTVLIYYAITNLSAIQMTDQERLYPRYIPWCGLLSCLFLAFWVEPKIWGIGLALTAVGLLLHRVAISFAKNA